MLLVVRDRRVSLGQETGENNVPLAPPAVIGEWPFSSGVCRVHKNAVFSDLCQAHFTQFLIFHPRYLHVDVDPVHQGSQNAIMPALES